MTKIVCDACGDEITANFNGAHGAFGVSLRFYSWWNPKGDERDMMLCFNCGAPVMRKLGFCYDTGRLLSISRGEYVTEATVAWDKNTLGGVKSSGIPADKEMQYPDAPLVKIEKEK